MPVRRMPRGSEGEPSCFSGSRTSGDAAELSQGTGCEPLAERALPRDMRAMRGANVMGGRRRAPEGVEALHELLPRERRR